MRGFTNDRSGVPDVTRVLIVADIHANAPALDAVLDAEPEHDAVIFLGDAVDNGPHPDAVCERLRELDTLAGVRGNHDRAVLAAGAGGSHDPNVAWQRWSYDRLSEPSRAYLRSLDRTATVAPADVPLRLHHGDFPPPNGHDARWRTRVTPEDDPEFFESVAARYDEDVVLHGHSHFPFAATVAGTRFVNPGSVGLQREGWPADRARYAVLESETGTFDLRSVTYDVSRVVRDARTLGSPSLALWDRPGVDSDVTSGTETVRDDA